MLEDEGYEVLCAFDGKEGVSLFKQEEPDLVITDVIMPDVDGLGFLMKTIDENRQCKVIAISGGGRIIGADECLKMTKLMGVDDALEKPFGMDDLLASIRKLFPQQD